MAGLGCWWSGRRRAVGSSRRCLPPRAAPSASPPEPAGVRWEQRGGQRAPGERCSRLAWWRAPGAPPPVPRAPRSRVAWASDMPAVWPAGEEGSGRGGSAPEQTLGAATAAAALREAHLAAPGAFHGLGEASGSAGGRHCRGDLTHTHIGSESVGDTHRLLCGHGGREESSKQRPSGPGRRQHRRVRSCRRAGEPPPASQPCLRALAPPKEPPVRSGRAFAPPTIPPRRRPQVNGPGSPAALDPQSLVFVGHRHCNQATGQQWTEYGRVVGGRELPYSTSVLRGQPQLRCSVWQRLTPPTCSSQHPNTECSSHLAEQALSTFATRRPLAPYSTLHAGSPAGRSTQQFTLELPGALSTWAPQHPCRPRCRRPRCRRRVAARAAAALPTTPAAAPGRLPPAQSAGAAARCVWRRLHRPPPGPCSPAAPAPAAPPRPCLQVWGVWDVEREKFREGGGRSVVIPCGDSWCPKQPGRPGKALHAIERTSLASSLLQPMNGVLSFHNQSKNCQFTLVPPSSPAHLAPWAAAPPPCAPPGCRRRGCPALRWPARGQRRARLPSGPCWGHSGGVRQADGACEKKFENRGHAVLRAVAFPQVHLRLPASHPRPDAQVLLASHNPSTAPSFRSPQRAYLADAVGQLHARQAQSGRGVGHLRLQRGQQRGGGVRAASQGLHVRMKAGQRFMAGCGRILCGSTTYTTADQEATSCQLSQPRLLPCQAALTSMVGMAASKKMDSATPRMQAPAASSTAEGLVFQACTSAGQKALTAAWVAGAAATAAAAATSCCRRSRGTATSCPRCCRSRVQPSCCWHGSRPAGRLPKHADAAACAAAVRRRAPAAAGGWIARCTLLQSSMLLFGTGESLWSGGEAPGDGQQMGRAVQANGKPELHSDEPSEGH